MNRVMVFSGRNTRELLRDPLNVAFALGFPLVVMFLLTAIQANVPTDIFAIEMIAPGMAVFGLSFIALFSGTLIARDRGTAFLMRLYASPMRAKDFIRGYVLPLIPLSMLQSAVCFVAAMFLGLPVSIHILAVLVAYIPVSILFIGIGLLAGTLLNDKQVGGICGALLTNLSAWLSGTWFDLSLVGGAFEAIAYCLPFAHANDLGKAILAGDYAESLPHLAWVMAYAVVIMGLAMLVFRRKMKAENM